MLLQASYKREVVDLAKAAQEEAAGHRVAGAVVGVAVAVAEDRQADLPAALVRRRARHHQVVAQEARADHPVQVSVFTVFNVQLIDKAVANLYL